MGFDKEGKWFDTPKTPGVWGNWHYSHDGYLNLLPNDRWTVEDPFYDIDLKEFTSMGDVWFWVNHISRKNKQVYGNGVLEDLIDAFAEILWRGAQIHDGRSYDPQHLNGKKLVKNYSKYLVSKQRRNVSARQRVTILERDRYTCQLCGAKAPDVPLEIDHKHPHSKGGATTDENLWVLCKPCNSGKSDRILQLP